MNTSNTISVIIPFFNAEKHISNCLESITNQTQKNTLEIIMVNDGSTDSSMEKISKFNSLKIKLLNVEKNSGPATARNLGITASTGKYLYFLDADDELDTCTFEKFNKTLKEKNFDVIFSDKKRMLNSQNLKENNYEYETDKILNNEIIISLMKKRFFYPHESHRIFDLTGKLIKKDLITNNKILFDSELRYLEDECFIWSVLSFVKEAKYIKDQLYTYNVRHGESSGISEAFTNNFKLSNFLKVKNQIKQSLEEKKIDKNEALRISNQAYIYIVIGSLISLNRSILIGKIKEQDSYFYLKKMIKEIIQDKQIPQLAKKYKTYKNESRWIPLAISLRSGWFVEFFCKKRTKEILKKRKN